MDVAHAAGGDAAAHARRGAGAARRAAGIVAAPAPAPSRKTARRSVSVARGARSRAGTPARPAASSSLCSGLGRDVAAEARAIHAESYLSEGRYADAVAGYRIVFRDFPHTPQAESALYAVAQLESEHGRPVEARASLQAYLARYPHGRFAKEAADRLARISPPQPR